ncbi:sulfatase [Planctomycetes bacterium Poly30]|uniref:sulfatase n=1 Tax=Saltatorellus ferox TaxID=2528018 RepID=UPI0011A69BEC
MRGDIGPWQRALRALGAGACVLLASAWIMRLPGIGDVTLGLLSERFGALTWVAAAGTVVGVMHASGRGTSGAWGGTLGAALVLLARYGLDADITRRRSACIALACIAIPWLLHAMLDARRRRTLPWLAVAAASAAGVLGLRAADLQPYRRSLPPLHAGDAVDAPANAPDIVLITLDTTRYDALLTAAPTLQAFASRSIAFPRTTAEAPFTHPSMASLLTSRTPLEHDSISTSPWIDPRLPTLATHLRGLGYRTAGFLDNPWLSPEFGISVGYEHLDRRTDLDRIEGWLENPKDARPALLHVHLFEPHGPYELRPEYLERLGRTIDPASRERLGATISADFIRAGEIPGAHDLGEPDFQWLETIYLTEVAAMDGWLASLFELLAARDPEGERTLIAITADHGEEFGDHGALHHSHTLYEELVHVPLFLRLPGHGVSVSHAPAQLIDVTPTLLEAAGLPPLPGAAGASLLGAVPEDRVQVSTRFHAHGAHLFSIRKGEWKLHLRVDAARDPRSEAIHFASEALPGSIELYRISSDPEEAVDLAAKTPEEAAGKVDELIEDLTRWQASVRLRIRADGGALDAESQRHLSRETYRELRKLGYSADDR